MSSSWDASWSQTQDALRELRTAYDAERGSSQALLFAHRSFNAVLRDLSLARDLHSVFGELARVVETLQEGRVAAIHLLEPDTGHLRAVSASNLPDFFREALEGLGVGAGIGCCGAAAHLGRPVIAENLAIHPNWEPLRALAREADLAACWSVPILAEDSSVLGTFASYARTPGGPAEWELEILDAAARIASVALEKEKLEESLRFAASYDYLTQLLNRHAAIPQLEKMLAISRRHEMLLGLLFIDLDNFKAVNDRLGHESGDRLLRHTADLLRNLIRESDVLARYGGDEFLAGVFIKQPEDLTIVGQRFEALFHERLAPDLAECGVGVSVGFAVADDATLDSTSSLIEAGDRNMYAVKRARRAGGRSGPVQP
jgi:diguanylate cyclase (GGDEF)-like protein